MAPIAIPPADLQSVTGSDKLFIYSNQTFSADNPPGAFDILRAACPAGKTAIPNATRTNLAVSPLDWTNRQPANVPGTGWYIYPGISVSLFDSIQSLPSFLVQRTDANLLEAWRGAEQSFTVLKANTDYAFSFLVKPGTVTAVDWVFIRCITPSCATTQDESVTVTTDLQTLSTKVQWSINISNVSAVVSPQGNGFAVTVNFTSSPTDNVSGDIIKMIIAPSTQGQAHGRVGDSIFATAAELVEVANFCQ